MPLRETPHGVGLTAGQRDAINQWLTQNEMTGELLKPIAVERAISLYTQHKHDHTGNWTPQLRPLENIPPAVLRAALFHGYSLRPDVQSEKQNRGTIMQLREESYGVRLTAKQRDAINEWLTKNEITGDFRKRTTIESATTLYRQHRQYLKAKLPSQLRPLDDISPEMFHEALLNGCCRRPNAPPKSQNQVFLENAAKEFNEKMKALDKWVCDTTQKLTETPKQSTIEGKIANEALKQPQKRGNHMKDNVFIHELQLAGLDTVQRFLDASPAEVFNLSYRNELDSAIQDILMQMPDEERQAFEDELKERAKYSDYTGIETMRVKQGNVIKTYLAVKRGNQPHSDAFACITSIVQPQATVPNSAPAAVAQIVSTIDYVYPGKPTDAMSIAIDRAYQQLENDYTK